MVIFKIFSLTLASLLMPRLLSAFMWEGSVDIVPGIVTEKLTLPLIYETYVPGIIEFKRPRINVSDISTDVIFRRNCTGPEYTPNSPCPTAFYIAQQVESFVRYFNELHAPAQSSSSRSRSNYGEPFNWNDLDSSLKAVDSPFATDAQVNEHIAELGAKSPLNVSFLERNNTDLVAQVDTTNIQNMISGFYNQFWLHISSDRIDDALFSNAISLYQTMLHQRHLMEAIRWNRAMSDCAEFKLSRNFVSEEKLSRILESVGGSLNSTSYDYQVAIDIPDLAQYYVNKLTTCVTTESSVFVTIRIPIVSARYSRKQGTALQLLKTHSVPFYRPQLSDNEVVNSSPNVSSICRINLEQGIYLYDTQLGYVKSSNCKSYELCQLPQDWSHGLNDLCISAVVESKGEEVVEHCSWACDTIDKLHLERFPLIHQVGRNVWVLTGRADGAFVRCPNEADGEIPKYAFGAARIEVNSSCRLFERGTPSKNMRPLPGLNMVPVHWTVDRRLGPHDNVELDVNSKVAKALARGNEVVDDGREVAVNDGSSVWLWLCLFAVTVVNISGLLYIWYSTRRFGGYGRCHERNGSVVYLSPSTPNAESDILNY